MEGHDTIHLYVVEGLSNSLGLVKIHSAYLELFTYWMVVGDMIWNLRTNSVKVINLERLEHGVCFVES